MTYIPKQQDNFPTINFGHRILIRVLDLIAAAIGLILLSPILLAIALIIKLTSPGPVFYRAVRVGQNERIFKLFKFRSMRPDADQSGQAITVKDDPRVTPIGRFLRRTKVDELPQLINVLRGKMSLVGPRPEDPRYVALYTPEQRGVLSVRPGMTSRASVYYREEEELLSDDNWERVYEEQLLPRKLAADLAYLEKRTIWTDLRLILETVFAVSNGGERLNSVVELRNRHFFMLDVLALALIPALALGIRLGEFKWGPALIFFTGVSLLIKLSIFYSMRLYDRYWRYAGVTDLAMVVLAVGLVTMILTGLFVGLYPLLEQQGLAMFRTVPLIGGFLTLLAVGGSRYSVRALYSWKRHNQLLEGGRQVLIVGAGETGSMVVRELQANPKLDREPVGFVDDDPNKVGARIQGLPVMGTSLEIPDLVKRCRVQEIVIAIPSASLARQEEILSLCEQTGIVARTLPGMYEILGGYKTVSRMPRLDIDRLLGRQPVEADHSLLTAQLAGATVLVTGAGGSIGSELCRQIVKFGPKEIILLGHGENSIFEINLELKLSFPELVTHPVIIDVRDQPRVSRTVAKYKPDIIFHAAAHKHVPFMEACVEEAFTNNVIGTQNVLQAAEHHNVERFVLVSSDKAVNPASIMGATKRIAEWLVIAAARRSGRTYMAVRFGNVLDSRGSVLRVFQQQIAVGGPLTVTHPEMRRYFMTIPEAVQLLLQAASEGQGGEVFVLDMGQPIRILDIATDLIRSAGLELGRDIQIVYSGIRPGEKLDEELFLAGEQYHRTQNPKIFVASPENIQEAEALEQIVSELAHLTRRMDDQTDTERFLDLLFKICYYIDSYQPQQQPALPDRPARSRFKTRPLPLYAQPASARV